jgi:hypothetical protein
LSRLATGRWANECEVGRVVENDRSLPWSLVDSDLGKLIKSIADLGPRVFACIA